MNTSDHLLCIILHGICLCIPNCRWLQGISMRKIEKDVRFWGMCDDRLRCETCLQIELYRACRQLRFERTKKTSAHSAELTNAALLLCFPFDP